MIVIMCYANVSAPCAKTVNVQLLLGHDNEVVDLAFPPEAYIAHYSVSTLIPLSTRLQE